MLLHGLDGIYHKAEIKVVVIQILFKNQSLHDKHNPSRSPHYVGNLLQQFKRNMKEMKRTSLSLHGNFNKSTYFRSTGGWKRDNLLTVVISIYIEKLVM